MRRMNFEQKEVARRDVGGLPGSALLLVATVLVLWMLSTLMHNTYY
jgi:predicted acyltransferase